MLTYFLNNYFVPLLMLAVTAMAGCLGYCLSAMLTDYLADETRQRVAHVAMLCAEQVFDAFHGTEKMNKALEIAADLLAAKGVPFRREEMTVLIEAALKEFKAAARS